MRINWAYVKLFVLMGFVVFLFVFASMRNMSKTVSKPIVTFKGENNLFISNETVSKLLIQNFGGVTNVTKETLDLNKLEKALKSNPMIKTAEVYVAINGVLRADVEQKKPIARVMTGMSYYVDDEGIYMPLSKNYSARVPIVTGFVDKRKLYNIYKVASKIDEDEFLRKNVIEIQQGKNRTISLRMRQCKFLVQLGDVSFLDKKINNLKAFYQKSIKEKTLDDYSKVNLRFDNQVVCTKV